MAGVNRPLSRRFSPLQNYLQVISLVVSEVDSPTFTPASTGVTTVANTFHGIAPSPQLVSTVHISTGENSVEAYAPSPTLVFTTGASAKLLAPMPGLVASGTVTIFANANLLAPSPILSASGTIANTLSASLKAPSPLLSAFGGGQAAFTSPRPTLVASGTVGILLRAELVAPSPKIVATVSSNGYSYANLTAPSPRMGNTAFFTLTAPRPKLYAAVSMTVAAAYEAYAINLKHNPQPNVQPVDEATHYTNFPFTHVVRYRNSYYGANSTGLYLLEGTTDNGTAIAHDVQTAMTDFKNPALKTIGSAYLGGRFGPASVLSLIAGEKAPTTYAYSTPRGQLAQNYRVVFGRGLKARYYALGLSGTGACELDDLTLDVHNLTRRI